MVRTSFEAVVEKFIWKEVEHNSNVKPNKRKFSGNSAKTEAFLNVEEAFQAASTP